MAADPNGNRIVMLDSDMLQIEHVEKAQHWRATSSTEVTVVAVWFFHIAGRARDLPPGNYGAYFVYRLSPNAKGFKTKDVTLIVGGNSKRCCLDPQKAVDDVPTSREGNWLEIEMGRFYSDGFQDSVVDLVVQEHSDTVVKSGLTVRGIELRPV